MTNALDAILNGPTTPNPTPADLSHWAKYATVLSAGYIEASIRILLVEFIQAHSNAPIHRYVLRRLEDFTNASPGKIEMLLDQFDSQWFDGLEALDNTQQIRSSVGSIVSNRHLIAHGRPSGVTMHQISNWYRDAKRMIQFFDSTIQA